MKKTLLFALSLLLLAGTTGRANGLFFIENVGQLTDQYHQPRKDIDLVLRSGGLNVFIGAGSIHYQFTRQQQQANEPASVSFSPLTGCIQPGFAPLQIHRLEMELPGADKSVTPLKEGKLQYYERYYLPQFPEEGGKALAYSRIVYKDIYPHIDWVIYINGQQVEYDFVIHEGGNPADIKMQYKGADAISLERNGDLLVSTGYGSISEKAPSAWQEDGSRVAASFVLNDNTVSFDVAQHTGTLLIDPYIEWATYYGGAGFDGGTRIAEDASANVYIASTTLSGSNIATTGAFDVSYADSGDIYIAKFNSDGTRLWGTYLGGSATDDGGGIVYDYHGNVYISGSTDNTAGIATTGSNQSTFSGPHVGGNPPFYGGDAFLVKFDSNGSRIWGTYFGGSSEDRSNGIQCDTAGNIYMTGITYSVSNIATVGAHQTNLGGSYDGFLVKYNSSGQKLWSTYYGGNSVDVCGGVVTFHNSIYIIGYTESTNNISSSGAHQFLKPSDKSGLIVCFGDDGTRIWGTYFGGNTASANTYLYNVTCDTSGDVLITGMTNDQNGLTTTGCHQPVYGGDGMMFPKGDAILAKFSSQGSIQWCTYFGGSGNDWGVGLECNQLGEVYLTGSTTSLNNIALNAFQPINMGGTFGADGFIGKFSDLGVCIWSTYLGGQNDDYLGSCHPSAPNHLYISGQGSSFPTTTNSHQPNFGGGSADTYLAKFYDFPTGISGHPIMQAKLDVYPHPNNGTFTIAGTLPNADQDISLSVLDLAGQMIHTEHLVNNSGHFSKKITLPPSLPAGIYILNLVSGNYSATERLIKN